MLEGFKLDCLDQTSFLASLPSAAMFPFPHPLSAFAQQQCSCSLTPLCFSSLTAMFLFPLLFCAFPIPRSNVPVPSPSLCFPHPQQQCSCSLTHSVFLLPSNALVSSPTSHSPRQWHCSNAFTSTGSFLCFRRWVQEAKDSMH